MSRDLEVDRLRAESGRLVRQAESLLKDLIYHQHDLERYLAERRHHDQIGGPGR